MSVLILANSADPHEMELYAAFHVGLHCLTKVSRVQRVKKYNKILETHIKVPQILARYRNSFIT